MTRDFFKHTVHDTSSSKLHWFGTRLVTDAVHVCVARRECDQVALDLRRAGIGAQSYHAGLTDAERTAVQERWMDEGPCKVWWLHC